MITKLEIGTPPINYSLLLDTKSESFYLTSVNNSTKNKEEKKYLNIYNFAEGDCYNEYLSSSFKNINNHTVPHGLNHYNEICLSSEKIYFNIYNKNGYNLLAYENFPIKLARNHDDNIPGYIGLIFINSNKKYEKSTNFIRELKIANLTDDYYWFFNFEEIDPLKVNLKGQFIIGSLPHEIFPKKFLRNNYIYTKSHKILYGFNAWRIRIDKIYVNNNTQNFKFENTNIALSYLLYARRAKP